MARFTESEWDPNFWAAFLWPENLTNSDGRSRLVNDIKYGEGDASMGLPLHGVSHGLKIHELMSPTVHIWDRIQNIRDGGSLKDHLKWSIDDQNHNLQDAFKSGIPALAGFLGGGAGGAFGEGGVLSGLGGLFGAGGGASGGGQVAAPAMGGGGGMNWNNVLGAINTGANVYGTMNPPTMNMQTAAPTAGQTNMSPGGAMAPPQRTTGPVQPQAADTSALQTLASTLAKSGPPPASKPEKLKSTKEEVGPPRPDEDPLVQQQVASDAQKNEVAIGQILAALPEAIAIAAPFLGLGPEDNRQYAAPIAGGPGPAQNMQQSPLRRPSIGEILNSIPRLR